MKPIRIQSGSNIFVAAMEVWAGEEFIVWLKNIGKFGRPILNGNVFEPGWIELFCVP